ncbi:MAG: HNH endonuclease [bacterium]
MFLNYKNKNSFYSSKNWRKLRDYQLSIHPICEECNHLPAVEVDHIVPLWIYPNGALELGNIQSLCHKCHKKKTIQDNQSWHRINSKNKKPRKKGKIINKRWDV